MSSTAAPLPGASAPTQFGSLQIALHWLVLVMMVAVYIGMEFRGDFPKDIRPTLVRLLHYSFGVTILLLVFLRIGLRFTSPAPPITPPPPHWQERAGSLMHLALYAFMIAMPLLALCSYSLRGKAVWFYGMDLGPFVAKNVALAKQLKPMTWHKTIGEWGYWLLGAHAAAALFHHYVMKDDTLRRMLPRRG